MAKFVKIQLSGKQKQFLTENYKTMNNRLLAEAIGIKESLVYERMKEFGLRRTPEEITALLCSKRKTCFMVELSDENIQYIKDNYLNTTNPALAAKLGLHPATLRKKMNELNIIRSAEERKKVWGLRGKADPAKLSLATCMIETCDGVNIGKRRWHRDKWILNNGKFSAKKKMLVYKDDIGNFDDLILIYKRNYYAHIKNRDARKTRTEVKSKKEAILDANRKLREEAKAKKEAILDATEDEKIAIAFKKAAKYAIAMKKKQEADEMERKFEAIKAARPKNMRESNIQLAKEDKVPVKLDAKTTIWVKRDKCTEVSPGIWQKNSPLNVVKHNEEANKKLMKPLLKKKNNEETKIEIESSLDISA